MVQLHEVRASELKHVRRASLEVIRGVIQRHLLNTRRRALFVDAVAFEGHVRRRPGAFRVPGHDGHEVLANLLPLPGRVRVHVVRRVREVRDPRVRLFNLRRVHDVRLRLDPTLIRPNLFFRLGVDFPLEHRAVVPADGDDVPPSAREAHVHDVRGVPDVPDAVPGRFPSPFPGLPLHPSKRRVLNHARPVEQLHLAVVVHDREELAVARFPPGGRPAIARVDVRPVRGAFALLRLWPDAHDAKPERARLRVPPLVAHAVPDLLPGVSVVVQELVRAARALQNTPVRELRVERGPVHVRDVRAVPAQAMQTVVLHPC